MSAMDFSSSSNSSSSSSSTSAAAAADQEHISSTETFWKEYTKCHSCKSESTYKPQQYTTSLLQCKTSREVDTRKQIIRDDFMIESPWVHLMSRVSACCVTGLGLRHT